MNELKVIVDPIQQLSKRVENNLTTLKALTEEEEELSILIEEELKEDNKETTKEPEKEDKNRENNNNQDNKDTNDNDLDKELERQNPLLWFIDKIIKLLVKIFKRRKK